MHDTNKYIDIDFYRLWKHIHISRSQKEALKKLLFSNAPILFKNFISYQNWKQAQYFRPTIDLEDIKIPLNKNKNVKQLNLAIIIHVFYVDVFNNILSILNDQIFAFSKIFISCPKELNTEIEKLLNSTSIKYEIITVENHGRDILPFLKILPLVFEQGYDLVLKLHTKKSNHLNKNIPWGKVIFDKLISNNKIIKIKQVFENYNDVGILGPEGHILSMHLNYGGNPKRVKDICHKMGLINEDLKGFYFVAGSMFYARKEVMEPIIDLGLDIDDFEEENNQLDSTLSHAIERAFSCGLIKNNLHLVDSSSNIKQLNCHITKNHSYTI